MNLRTISLSAALVAVAAAPAVHADTMISGHAGKVFGGDLNDSATTYGGAITLATAPLASRSKAATRRTSLAARIPSSRRAT